MAAGTVLSPPCDGPGDPQLLVPAARGASPCSSGWDSSPVVGVSPPFLARPQQRARGGGEQSLSTLPALDSGRRAAHPPTPRGLADPRALTAAEPPLPDGAGAPPHRREPTAGRASRRSLLQPAQPGDGPCIQRHLVAGLVPNWFLSGFGMGNTGWAGAGGLPPHRSRVAAGRQAAGGRMDPPTLGGDPAQGSNLGAQCSQFPAPSDHPAWAGTTHHASLVGWRGRRSLQAGGQPRRGQSGR